MQNNFFDKSFIKQLFEELEVLKLKNVISSETENAIKNYYETELSKVEEAKPVVKNDENIKKNSVKNVPFILSSVAAFCIFAGIVSLIAYNWASISRLVKTISAFIISFLPPVAYILLRAKVKKNWFREFSALLWALLFGSAVAFISQIFRLPSNITLFLLVWTISSVLITYALNSFATFFASLILLFSYVISAQYFDFNSAVFFYPIFVSLLPFTKNLKNKKSGLYFLLIFFAIMFGNVMEKAVPGLWILGYAFLSSIIISIGIIKKDSVLKYFGIGGISILSLILCKSYFWIDIGFSNFRSLPKYTLFGNIVDFVIVLSTIFFAIILFIKSFKLQTEKLYIQFLNVLPVVFLIFFISRCFGLEADYASNFFEVVYVLWITTFIFRSGNKKFSLLFLILLICLSSSFDLFDYSIFYFVIFENLFLFIFLNKKIELISVLISVIFLLINTFKNSLIFALDEINMVVSLALGIFAFLMFFIKNRKVFLPFLVFFFVFAIKIFVANSVSFWGIVCIFYFSAFYFYSRVVFKNAKNLHAFSSVLVSIFLILAFIALNTGESIFYISDFGSSFESMLFLVFVIFFTLVPFVKLLIERKKINYILPLLCIYSLIPFHNNFYEALIFALFITGIILSVFNKSLLNSNFYTVALCLIFIIKFFFQTDDLISRGVAFIISGVLILILNVFITKKFEVKNEDSDSE